MMFLLDLAFTVELLAFGLGIAFLIWAYRCQGKGAALAKVAGYIITIAAVLALICTTSYGFCYWSKGYFTSPTAVTHQVTKKVTL